MRYQWPNNSGNCNHAVKMFFFYFLQFFLFTVIGNQRVVCIKLRIIFLVKEDIFYTCMLEHTIIIKLYFLTCNCLCYQVYEGTALLKAVQTIPLGSKAIHK